MFLTKNNKFDSKGKDVFNKDGYKRVIVMKKLREINTRKILKYNKILANFI